MNYKKYDVITFEDKHRVVVLSSIEYEGITYLYVDMLNNDKTKNLGQYHILRDCGDGYLEKETDTNILTKIIPLFSKDIK